MFVVLKETLRAYRDKAEWLEVYSKIEDTGSFVVGKVLDLDDDYVLLGLIHPSGVYDGYMALSLDKIYQVKEKTNYIARLLTFMEHEGKFDFSLLPGESHGVLLDFMRRIQQSGWVASMEINNSGYNDVIGRIDSVDGTTVAVTEITDDGDTDGKTTLARRAVTRISADGEKERRLQWLAGWKQPEGNRG